MSAIYTSIDQLVGNTPLLELTHIERERNLQARVLVKLEYFNPAGSVKDRVARSMLDRAEDEGIIAPNAGYTIIEPTSGNTGVGLASMATARGYRVVITMPETMSMERRLLMGAYGAELVLTPGAEGMKGAIARAQQLAAETPKSWVAGQFSNPANPAAHEQTTGPDDLARHRRRRRHLRGGRGHRRHRHGCGPLPEEQEARGPRGGGGAGRLAGAFRGARRPA